MQENKKPLKNVSEDLDEVPDLDETFFETAEVREGTKLVRRGRPKVDHPKQPVSIRLDSDLLEALKASGKGWQSRANEILRKAVLG